MKPDDSFVGMSSERIYLWPLLFLVSITISWSLAGASSFNSRRPRSHEVVIPMPAPGRGGPVVSTESMD